MHKLNKTPIVLATFLAVGLLTSCTDRDLDECAPYKDWGVETVGVALPKPLPIDLSKIESTTLAKHYTGNVSMLASVLYGNFADAQTYWDTAAAMPDASARMRAMFAGINVLDGRGLYALDAAQAWEKAHPDSRAARLFLGIAYSKAASEGRGSQYTSKTSKEQFDLLSARSAKAEIIFQSLIKEDDFYSWGATAGLKNNLFLSGRSEEGWRAYEYLIGKSPQYGWLYFGAAEYANPRWAGKKSQERTRFILQLADKNKLNTLDRKVLER